MTDNKLLDGGQLFTFMLSDEIYGIEISKVREVMDYKKITTVPKTPDFMKGVINLRGGVVPVIDLRLKFGMEETEKTVDTCIIIVDIMVDNEQTFIGALADSVKEVITLEPENIEPAPKIGTKLDTDFIKGMGKLNNDFIIVLDIEKIFTTEELVTVKEMSKE
jgi:purine-binding chemotaxis protein CheW